MIVAAIVLGYLVIGIGLVYVLRRHSDELPLDDPLEFGYAVVIWPLILALGAIWVFGKLVMVLIYRNGK